MSGRQIQAGRVLIGWTQLQLAEAAGVSIPTVKRAEGAGQLKASQEADAAIRKALEARGIQFLQNGEVAHGDGVALRGKD